jgi:hypothetical protein
VQVGARLLAQRQRGARQAQRALRVALGGGQPGEVRQQRPIGDRRVVEAARKNSGFSQQSARGRDVALLDGDAGLTPRGDRLEERVAVGLSQLTCLRILWPGPGGLAGSLGGVAQPEKEHVRRLTSWSRVRAHAFLPS